MIRQEEHVGFVFKQIPLYNSEIMYNSEIVYNSEIMYNSNSEFSTCHTHDATRQSMWGLFFYSGTLQTPACIALHISSCGVPSVYMMCILAG